MGYDITTADYTFERDGYESDRSLHWSHTTVSETVAAAFDFGSEEDYWILTLLLRLEEQEGTWNPIEASALCVATRIAWIRAHFVEHPRAEHLKWLTDLLCAARTARVGVSWS